MAGTIGQVAFFVALLVVILIHEAAHFAVAKRFGIKVEEFFIGFGPRLWSFRRGETEYGVKAIPAGGYVRIAGMNPFQEIPPEELPRTFGARPIWQRALVIFAGPATHFVLAFVFFAVWLGAVGGPTARDPLIGGVAPTLAGKVSPAAAVGLKPGDRIVAVGPISNPTDLQLIAYTQLHVGDPIALSVRRDDRLLSFTVTPVLASNGVEKVGRIGITLVQARERSGPIGAIGGSVRLIGSTAANTVTRLGQVFGPQGVGRIYKLLFTGAQRQPGDTVSVVGTARLTGQIAQQGHVGDVLFIFGLINIFIGILNLLPLLPFDGGHLAVLAIEKVRGRKIDARKLVPITAAVATFLILFMVSVVYLDLTKPLNMFP